MTASGASCVAPAAAAAIFTLLSSSNAATMPMTVPSSPMNGALFPSVPRNARRFSSLRRWSALAPSIASCAASTPRSASTRPATTTAASALRDASSRRRAPSRSPPRSRRPRSRMSSSMSSRSDQYSHARSSMMASETMLRSSIRRRTQPVPRPTIALFTRSISEFTYGSSGSVSSWRPSPAASRACAAKTAEARSSRTPLSVARSKPARRRARCPGIVLVRLPAQVLHPHAQGRRVPSPRRRVRGQIEVLAEGCGHDPPLELGRGALRPAHPGPDDGSRGGHLARVGACTVRLNVRAEEQTAGRTKFNRSPSRGVAHVPSATRASRTALKTADWSDDQSRRCMRGSRGPRSFPRSQARARAALSPSRPNRCAPKALGTPSRAMRVRAASTSPRRSRGHVADGDGEAVPGEVPGLHLVAVGRGVVHDDAVAGRGCARARRGPPASCPRGVWREMVCVVTARLSFIPAKPASRGSHSRARAIARPASSVVEVRLREAHEDVRRPRPTARRRAAPRRRSPRGGA